MQKNRFGVEGEGGWANFEVNFVLVACDVLAGHLKPGVHLAEMKNESNRRPETAWTLTYWIGEP